MKNLTHKPRIFVGASSEAEDIDRQVTRIIESLGAEAIGWRDVFRPGDYPLDVLVDLPSSIDGALLIATPDDPTVCRLINLMSPRDNVIFELGIFISRLGKRRTGIVHVVPTNQPPAALPTDLNGLTVIKYFPGKSGTNEYQLEVWLDEVISHVSDKNPYVDELIELLRKQFGTLPFSWREIIQRYVIKDFKSSIDLALKGEIYLSAGEYYHALYSEIDNVTTKNEVLAVGTLSAIIWKGDPEQQDYLEKNLKAAERGTNIRRLFILPDDQWAQIGPVLKKQIDKGIEIRRAPLEFLGKFFNIEDMVIFKDTHSKESRAYMAEPSINPNRIRRGRIIVNKEIVTDLIDTFEKVWDISPKINSKNVPKITTVKKSLKLPSINLKEYKLDKPVVTCMEAAQAKGIPLENELKTLLLKTSNGFVAIELPGDAKASLRKIKDFLEVKKAHLADLETLAQLGLEPGTVSTVRAPVWDMPHLLSKRLLNLDEISTNSGNKKGYYRFEPSLLLKAENVMIGDFEEDYMDK
jgi:prolyl-tRNA editing enzyme YbaK/EbsC (Cys-tRNA(Pro) deacylase)